MGLATGPRIDFYDLLEHYVKMSAILLLKIAKAKLPQNELFTFSHLESKKASSNQGPCISPISH